MRHFILSFLLSAFLPVFSQTPIEDCPCCKPEHGQFDFWEGNWVVFDTSGNEVGKNNIVKLQDNCILQENWVSKSITGTSYNYYNSTDSTWNQLWIDNQGGSLVLKGGLQDGKMVLKSELLKGKRVAWYYNQITWTPNDNGSVTQTWEIFDDKHNLLTTAFQGIYKLTRE